MKTCRIHIAGASGAGTTTLGRALADALAVPHHDTDDYFWLPTSPPYRARRALEDRLRLMEEMFLDLDGWVLSGSIEGWGEPINPRFDAVVFLQVSPEIRVSRLRDRETRHFGAEAVALGGWRHEETEEFLEWASHYDDGSREGRSLPRHEAWLTGLACAVLRLDGQNTTTALVNQVLEALELEQQSPIGSASSTIRR